MSYQGDDSNRPRERQQSHQGTQQPSGRAQPPRQGRSQATGPQQSPQRGQQPQGYQQTGQQQPRMGQQGQFGQQTGVAGQPQTQQPTQGQQPTGTRTGTVPGQSTTAQGTAGQSMGGQPMAGGQPQAPHAQQPQPQGRIQPITRERLRPVTVETVVETDVVTARTDEPITNVVSKMMQNQVGSVVVLDEDGTPAGILTDRKIALALDDDPDIANREAGEVISGDLTTATVDATVTDVIELMNESSIRRLPIVDDDGNLQGIVTLDDVLLLIGSQFDSALDVVAAQASRH